MDILVVAIKGSSVDFSGDNIVLGIHLEEGNECENEEEMRCALQGWVSGVLFCLGGVFRSHVLRFTFTVDRKDDGIWIAEWFKMIGKDKRYSSFVGSKETETKRTYSNRMQHESSIIRLVMVAKNFKGYSEEIYREKWALQCPNCELKHGDMKWSKL